VATYASRARDVFSELKALGESVKDDELAFNVLNGLRAEFETIWTILLASDQRLRLEAILPKLQQEENMKQLAGESQGEKETAVAYAAKQKGFKKGFLGEPGFGNFGQGFGNKGSPGNQGAQQKAQGSCTRPTRSQLWLLLLRQARSYEERLQKAVGRPPKERKGR
jgi:hypothetical protein